MFIQTHRVFLSVLILTTSVFVSGTSAEQIGLGDFGPEAVTENYESLSLPVNSTSIPTPLVIKGNTYDTDTGGLGLLGIGTGVSGTSGTKISTRSSQGFIDIAFGTPTQRAGITVGTTNVFWTATVSFFDPSDSLLGSIDLGSPAGVGEFAGWEDLSAGIKRFRIVDTSNIFVIGADNLITEIVPEPTTLGILTIGSLAMLRRRVV